tara:strand:+ start:288 stop:557 length:270 start_codon:yes stop_codon:yes gene_type:complete
MTRKKDFMNVWARLTKHLEEKIQVFDIEMMEYLNFTPESWRIWKPKLREKAEIIYFSIDEGESSTHHRIIYEGKTWKWIEFNPIKFQNE